MADIGQSQRIEALVLDTFLSLPETAMATVQILVGFPWVADGGDRG